MYKKIGIMSKEFSPKNKEQECVSATCLFNFGNCLYNWMKWGPIICLYWDDIESFYVKLVEHLLLRQRKVHL